MAALKSNNLKFYGGSYQIIVDGDYRLWFTLAPDGTLTLNEFDQGNH